MNIIKDLEVRIKHAANRITSAKEQLEKYEIGALKLSYVAFASTESSIEKNKDLIETYSQKLEEFKKQDYKELMEKEKQKEEIKKNNYFKYQKIRLKRDKSKTKEEIEEALMILCDLPEELQLEDNDIFEIAKKSKELYLLLHWDLNSQLSEIKEDFHTLTKSCINELNSELKLLNYMIPIIILQLSVLLKNIEENITDDKLEAFKGFPKFEDWWIRELWHSHQAYIGFFKWKQIILSLCISDEQKKAFEVIFKNWIFVKKILDTKGKCSYEYNKAFDKLICKYAHLEDELCENNLSSMKKIVHSLTQKTNFNTVSKKHNVITPYMQFKLDKKIEKERQKEAKVS